MRTRKPKLYERNLENEYLRSGVKSLTEFWKLKAKQTKEKQEAENEPE